MEPSQPWKARLLLHLVAAVQQSQLHHLKMEMENTISLGSFPTSERILARDTMLHT